VNIIDPFSLETPRVATLLALLAILVASPACQPAAEAPTADAPADGSPSTAVVGGDAVAEVNGVKVDALQVERVLDAAWLRFGPDVADASSPDTLRKALQLVIDGELLHQAALAEGMQVSEQDIQAQIESVRSQFAGDTEYASHLSEAGLTPAFLREQAERRLITEAYARSIAGDLILDEAQARRVYDARREEFAQGGQVRAAQILIQALPGTSEDEREAARKKIETVAARLRTGESFDALAREFSESPFAERGGDLGFVRQGRVLPELEQVLFATPAGETSEIFETPHGFNLVKILEKRSGSVPKFDEVRNSLMMVMAREQQDHALSEHVQRLRSEAEIRVLDPRFK
jgi:parvulin-like peptidyl-prolyl isomerase